jgi:hypothetical protein
VELAGGQRFQNQQVKSALEQIGGIAGQSSSPIDIL